MSYVANLNTQDRKTPFKNVFIMAKVSNVLESKVHQMYIITIDNYNTESMADAFYF
jgi:hypothetical protein